MKKLFGIVIVSLMFIVGCNSPFASNNKVGAECDDNAVVELVESIINKNLTKGDVSIKIDPNNIIEWDYKDGRYLCRARIEGTYNSKMQELKKILLHSYGFKFNKNNRDFKIT